MKEINNINKDVESIGILLKDHPEGNILGKLIDVDKLDFSTESLKAVDDYLNKVRTKLKKLTKTEIKTIILRCGTYLGEVMRKKEPHKFIWINYKTACKLAELTKELKKDIRTGIVLYNLKTKSVLYPLAKVWKFLEYGRGDNLWSFATVLLRLKE